jgi:hypothetical protein
MVGDFALRSRLSVESLGAPDAMSIHAPTREVVERGIREAFAGVTLGSGVSLRQAVASDDDRSYSPAEWAALKAADVVDDWSRVPVSALETDCIPFLDERDSVTICRSSCFRFSRNTILDRCE